MLGGGNKNDNHLTKSHHSNIENSN